MLKKVISSMLMGVIVAGSISGAAFASSAKSKYGHYSAGFSQSGGYSYANTYADSAASHTVSIYTGAGIKVETASSQLGADDGLNIVADYYNGTYAKYYISGNYGVFSGTLR